VEKAASNTIYIQQTMTVMKFKKKTMYQRTENVWCKKR